jgi:hypothetical protein
MLCFEFYLRMSIELTSIDNIASLNEDSIICNPIKASFINQAGHDKVFNRLIEIAVNIPNGYYAPAIKVACLFDAWLFKAVKQRRIYGNHRTYHEESH